MNVVVDFAAEVVVVAAAAAAAVGIADVNSTPVAQQTPKDEDESNPALRQMIDVAMLAVEKKRRCCNHD